MSRVIQSWNGVPEVIYKIPDLATIRSNGARRIYVRRERRHSFQKASHYGQNLKDPMQMLWDGREFSSYTHIYHIQEANRTIRLVSQENLEICAYVARLVAKVKISLRETDPHFPFNCATKPLIVLQSFIEDIVVNLRLVSYEDLMLLPKFDFLIQKALTFFKTLRGEFSTQEVARFIRYGSLLDFKDLIMLEFLGFLTQGNSNDLLDLIPTIRKNTPHEFSRRHGCTFYPFAELISNSHICENKPYLSAEALSNRFHDALQMEGSEFDVCRQSWMKQPYKESELLNVSSRTELRQDSIHEGNFDVSQNVKGYKWLTTSAKRRLRKAHQKENTSQEKKQSPHPSTIVPKRVTQWQKRKLERGTSPFHKCQTVLNLFSCGHNRRVLCHWCDDAWGKGISRECWLEKLGLENKNFRLPKYFPHPCSICPWHEFPAFPSAQTWAHRTPVQSFLGSRDRSKASVIARCNRSNPQYQQASFDVEGSHQWELVVRHKQRSRVPPRE
jgi:hypothetical protein